MKSRSLAIMLLLSWQAAMLSSPVAFGATVGCITSLVVGMTLITLMVGELDDDDPSAEPGERDALLEQLAFYTPVH